jgi:DNA-binding transcriptional MerR regulator
MTVGLTISLVAKRAGVGVETIRFYERRGLVRQPPRPRSGGFRSYDEEIVERIRFIRQAQELGFSLREIKELLSLRADPGADCGDIRRRAISKREEVESKISQLGKIRAALDVLIASCPGGGALRACTILDALAMREKEASTRRAPAHDRAAAAEAQKSRTKKGRAMRTAIFKIDGMHCDGCARTIEALLSMEPGVRKVGVSFEAREARVLFEPHTVSEDRLAAAISNAGYSVVGTSD